MAVKPQDNSGFLREVDEEVRRDQSAEFWRRWGLWIGIGIVLLLAAIGGYMWWTNQQRAEAEQETQQLDAILNDLGEGRTQNVDERLEALMASSRPGIRAAALFTRAGHAVETGDMETAISLFGEAAGDEDLPRQYRDIALIRQTALQFEDLEPQQVVDRLAELARPESPWFGSAAELTALALMRQGENERAGRLFAEIAGAEDVPESLKVRAMQLAGVLGVDAVPDEPVEMNVRDMSEPAGAPGEEEEAE